mmetsp:Transcript_143380/g.250284  ORF Transcript_143380/g.250284 Transcript_143380/m.250284 type:complete len:129 (-) Transcript_143380:801-1187(-)
MKLLKSLIAKCLHARPSMKLLTPWHNSSSILSRVWYPKAVSHSQLDSAAQHPVDVDVGEAGAAGAEAEVGEGVHLQYRQYRQKHLLDPPYWWTKSWRLTLTLGLQIRCQMHRPQSRKVCCSPGTPMTC